MHIVDPPALRNLQDGECYMDLIISQDLQPEHRTGLIVQRFLGYGVRIYTEAHILPEQMSKWMVIYHADCQRFCPGPHSETDFHRLCQVFRDVQRFTVQLQHIHWGDCLTIDLRPPLFLNVEDDDVAALFTFAQSTGSSGNKDCEDFDEISVMQHTASSREPHEPTGGLSHSIPHQQTINWKTQLEDILSSTQFRSCEETNKLNPVVRTWYSSHDTQLSCVSPRELALSEDASNWEIQVLRIWIDVVDPAAGHDIIVALPPPLHKGKHSVADLILHQHVRPLWHSVLISTSDSADRWNPVVEAHVILAEASVDILPTAVRRNEECSRVEGAIQCLVFCNGVMLNSRSTFPTFQGNVFDVFVERPTPFNPAHAPKDLPPDEPDVGSLMQVSSVLSDLDSNDIQNQPQFIQQLHASWMQVAQRVGDSEPTASVMTWFLNFYGDPFCRHGREVMLGPDFLQWNEMISRIWQDKIDVRSSYTYFRVHPQPFDRVESLVAHILVVQNEAPHRVPTLVTAYDRSGKHTLPSRFAAFQTNAVGCDRVLSQAGFHECLGTRPTKSCTIWHRNERIDRLYNLVNVIPGDHFFIVAGSESCHTPQERTAPKRGFDKISLLQLKTDLTSAIDESVSRQVDKDVECNQQRTKIHIALDEAIPASPMTTVSISRLEFLYTKLREPLLPSAQWNFQDIELHPSAIEELAWHAPWQDESTTGLYFYTDSSCNRRDNEAAAAAVLIVQTVAGVRFGGYLVFDVHGKPTSQRAEHVAIIGACFWALQILWRLPAPLARHVEVFFGFNSFSAGFAGAGLWNSNVHSDVSSISRAIVHLIEQIVHKPCQWQHIYSHTGHAWNELADCLSWHAAQHEPVNVELRTLCNLCTFDGQHPYLVDWLWLLHRSLQGYRDAPVVHNHAFQFDLAAPYAVNPVPDDHAFVQRTDQESNQIRVADECLVRVGTANVLTLSAHDGKDNNFLGSRFESLADQFDLAGYSFIGIQEVELKVIARLIVFTFCLLRPQRKDIVESSSGCAAPCAQHMESLLSKLDTFTFCMPPHADLL